MLTGIGEAVLGTTGGTSNVSHQLTMGDNADLRDGFTTLTHIETGARRYNAWIGHKLRELCGQRVLEIGAGIGTITAQIEPNRELVIALDVERFYVDKLKSRFRDKPHVRAMVSDVAHPDFETLRKERIDTILLSNVLEHIPDDNDAIRRFSRILQPNGRLLLMVPALPALFGSIDEAVGHHRRYSLEALSSVVEDNGFTIERIEWMNLVGIAGWFLNSKVLRRRSLSQLQLRIFDQFAPWLAQVESMVPKLPIGLSLFAVARVNGDSR